MAVPYYPWYPKDFFADDRTAELNGLQQGVLQILFGRMWMAENQFRDDDQRTAKVLRVDLEFWLSLKEICIENGLLYVEDGLLKNHRLSAEFEKAEAKCDKSRASARKRWDKPQPESAEPADTWP